MRVKIRLAEYYPIPENEETKAPTKNGEIVGTGEGPDTRFLKLETFIKYLRAGTFGDEVQVKFECKEDCIVYNVDMKGAPDSIVFRGIKGFTD